MDAAQEVEEIVSSSNFKVTYKRRLREAAGKVRENATELANRTTAAGREVTLEQENLRLRAELQQAEARITELSKVATKTASSSLEPRATRARIHKDHQLSTICPKPPKAAAKAHGTGANKRGDQGEDSDPSKVLLLIEAMAKEVAKLRQDVAQIGQGRATVGQTGIERTPKRKPGRESRAAGEAREKTPLKSTLPVRS